MTNWQSYLGAEKEKPYFTKMMQFLKLQDGKTIYPPKHCIFNAITHTPLNQVKVVILGQDPYHGPGQAHGLAFSVPDGVKPPPSLKNIYKELARSTQKPTRQSGNLEKWAKQGVFLLNTVLTVEGHKPHSHANIGWESLTDSMIKTISDTRGFVVFMLWGAHANKKRTLIDTAKHCILSTTHPSPLSAHRGFLGCNHFVLANESLQKNGIAPIDWS